MRDSGEKGAGMRDQDPPFQTLRKGLLQYTVDNEVYALARLAFYENLLIIQEINVSCLH